MNKYMSSNLNFVKHIESTNNLCMYKLNMHILPKNIFFPNATSITLINCNINGILNIVTPTIFPNLSNVNYLSIDSGLESKICEQFNNISWVFPNKSYEFYDFIIKKGCGRKDSNLIKEYLINDNDNDNNNDNNPLKFNLHIPDFGNTNREWWRSQFYEYIISKTKHYDSYKYCMYPGEKIE